VTGSEGTHSDVVHALYDSQAVLGREVNPTVTSLAYRIH